MRKFNISVNGKSYEVEVEEIGGAPSAQPAPAAPKAAATPSPAPAAAPTPAPKAAPAPAASAGSAPANATKISAPMPGTIVDIVVSQGQSVKKGDVLCILEAMKMENEIMAPSDGTVVGIYTQKGASVNSGDLLVALS